MRGDTIPESAKGIRLHRIQGDALISCESVFFVRGASAIDTVLRRAAISGQVEIGGDIQTHFADLLDEDGSTVETVALDRRSYGALKNHWMRCKVSRD